MTQAEPRSQEERVRLGALLAVILVAVVLLWSVREAAEPEPDLPLVAELPEIGPLPDFDAIRDIEEMKARFFDYLMPVVEAQNQWILDNRDYLFDLRDRMEAGEGLRRTDLRRLEVLSQRYRVELSDPPDPADIEVLLTRVDIIPPSLALAQAASESGWGRSRFARDANNLFGEWCYREGCGLVPQRRIAGARHEVTLFETVPDAIDSYFRNLNSHPAYEPMRELRAEVRSERDELLGIDLIDGLEMYSERRGAYLDELRTMIRINRLLRFDLPDDDQAGSDQAGLSPVGIDAASLAAEVEP